MAWGALRCVSSSTFVIAQEKEAGENGEGLKEKIRLETTALLKAVGFYCYFPTLYLGPLSTYDDYEEGVKLPYIAEMNGKK